MPSCFGLYQESIWATVGAAPAGATIPSSSKQPAASLIPMRAFAIRVTPFSKEEGLPLLSSATGTTAVKRKDEKDGAKVIFHGLQASAILPTPPEAHGRPSAGLAKQ